MRALVKVTNNKATYLSWNFPNPISFGRPVSQTKAKELAKDTAEVAAEQDPHYCKQTIYLYIALKKLNSMNPGRPEYPPVTGKTYSLFGQADSTAGYYNTIRELADRVIAMHPDTRQLVDRLQRFSMRKKRLKDALKHKNHVELMCRILNLIDPPLRKYTENTEQHLKKLPLTKLWDRRLATSREQYHLFMLEIELTNRIFLEEFRKAYRKIALLPYCLQDFSVNCRYEKEGFDYQCRQCSAKCFQNHASMILKGNNIEPYIWSGGNIKQLAGHTAEEKRTFGVLGIACVPELTFGMRSCRERGIPVVGVPLNANRCIRWFGEFLPNSVDLNELDRVVRES